MLFDLVSYPGWLSAALGIGLLVGWRTYLDAPRRNWRDGWIVWGALTFVIGVIAAALKLLPGRYGLWLELALLMSAFYIVGCFLGGGLKKLLGAHETHERTGVLEFSGATAMPIAASGRNSASLETERQATARAAADRLAFELAVKAEADRKTAAAKAAAAKAEADRVAAEAAAKAEADRRAAVAKAEEDRRAAEALEKAEADRRAEIERRAAAAARADAERLAAAALAKAEAERRIAAAVAKAVADRRAAISETDRETADAAEPVPTARRLMRGRRPSERRLAPPTRRRIVLWRKPPQWPRLNEKQIRPLKPRRVVWLQRVSQRSRLGETPLSRPTRPMRRRTLWLRRLPRPRPIGGLTLRYLRRRTEQT
jgi:hypothetical protein